MQCIVCILYSRLDTVIIEITKDLVGIRLWLCGCRSFKRLVVALAKFLLDLH